MDKAVLTCALNGVLTNPKTHPVPVTPEQMAASAKEAFDAGASVMHVHYRMQDEDHGHFPSWDPDVAASLMLQLEVVGAVTNGGVRDLPEVEQLGFQLFAPAAVVGHAHTRWVEINEPVQVGSLVVHPGDLIHGDEHGVMTIPQEIPLEDLLVFVHKFLASEKTIVDYCQGPDFDIDTLCQVMEEHNRRTSEHMS